MESKESYAVFAIAATIILLFAYYYLFEGNKKEKRNETKSRTGIISHFLRRKTGGFLLMGCLPLLISMAVFRIGPVQSGITMGSSLELWPWLLGVAALLVLLNSFNSKSDRLRSFYPEMRMNDWNLTAIFIASTGWIVYLTGYEFLFRGLLLFSCYDAFGLWPSIVINLAIYFAQHLTRSMKEAAATIPFGALLCYLTLESNSILPAVFLHSLQAISCEMFCVYRNPEMKFQLSKIIMS